MASLRLSRYGCANSIESSPTTPFGRDRARGRRGTECPLCTLGGGTLRLKAIEAWFSEFRVPCPPAIPPIAIAANGSVIA